jgi:hypothetical protein
MTKLPPLLGLALLALAACRDEPTVAEKFNAIAADVENKARSYDSEAENEVRAAEQRASEEAEALFRQNENALGNTVEVDVNGAGIALNAQ